MNTDLTTQDKRILRYLLPRSRLHFTRYFFKLREGRKFIINAHHKVMADIKTKVFEGDIKRLIVNIPPGYTKTEEWVINFMAEGLAINPQALFMHLSYADDLALWNSTQCRDIIELPEFQELFPMKIRHDVSSKKKWYTEHGGGVYATSAGGQVTGFRAGRIIQEIEADPKISALELETEELEKKLQKVFSEELHAAPARRLRRKLKACNKKLNRALKAHQPSIDEAAKQALDPFLKGIRERKSLIGINFNIPRFWGALIIDDPIKPDDAYSETLRNKINNRFMNTFKSRLAVESETPVILIMQRIHEDDPSGFLLTGGTGEKWHHLMLPVEIPEEPIKQWYPEEYTHGIPIEYDLPPGPLWKMKHSAREISVQEKADPYTHSAQYNQRPSPKGGQVFKDEFWKYFSLSAIPEGITTKRIYCDTAQKAKERNDWTVFQLWGYCPGKGIFLLDLFRAKLETPELEKALTNFWNKHKPQHKINPNGAQLVMIEDKSSGSGLIQTIQRKSIIPVQAIQRNIDKVTRAMDGVPHIASGNVYIPNDASWTFDFIEECRKFTPLMTHKFDDQIDPMLDAIEDMLTKRVNIYEGAI